MGLYFPLFYLQLDSVKHGNSETFSFYSVCYSSLDIDKFRSLTHVAGTFEWGKLYRSIIYWLHRPTHWRAHTHDHIDRRMRHPHSRHDRSEQRPIGRGHRDDLWLLRRHMLVFPILSGGSIKLGLTPGSYRIVVTPHGAPDQRSFNTWVRFFPLVLPFLSGCSYAGDVVLAWELA